MKSDDERFQDRPRNFRFRPIVGPRASDEVISQVCFAIQAGVYREGQYLPNTETLAGLFNVSRPTIGDAMKVLKDAGIVQPQRGSAGGLLVESVDIPESLTVLRKSRWREVAVDELVEARHPVEHAVARLARERFVDADRQLVQAAIDDMRSAKERGDLGAWVNADHRFHHAVGRAAGNEVLAETLHHILIEISMVGEKWIEEFEHAETVIGLHEKMLAALLDGSEQEVRVAVEHLLELVHDPSGEASRYHQAT